MLKNYALWDRVVRTVSLATCSQAYFDDLILSVSKAVETVIQYVWQLSLFSVELFRNSRRVLKMCLLDSTSWPTTRGLKISVQIFMEFFGTF